MALLIQIFCFYKTLKMQHLTCWILHGYLRTGFGTILEMATFLQLEGISLLVNLPL